MLGAGATRGATFVGADDPLKPPLDRDFWRILQVSKTGRTESGRLLLTHVRDVYGASLDVGLETVFNNLDAARTFHAAFKVKRGRHMQQPTKLINALNDVVPSLFRETIGPECAYHGALARALQLGDAVISLNDCVIDTELARYGRRSFDPLAGGYGIPVALQGATTWRPAVAGNIPDGKSVQLLKLHGSLNWRSAKRPLHLRREIYKSLPAGVIAPPMTNKPVTDEPFVSIWKEARRAAERVRRLVVIGYSLPQADGLVRTLFSTDLGRNLEEIHLAEPNDEVVQKLVTFFGGFAPKARVFTNSGLRQFALALEPDLPIG
ncbi:MAG: hypothetical protein ACJ757_10225 [Gaiellaceae bacterium]